MKKPYKSLSTNVGCEDLIPIAKTP